MGNSARCIGWTLDEEGGVSDRASDKGGLTYYGIAKINHAAAFGGRPPTRGAAAAWAREHVWQPIRGDDLPEPLDLIVFDSAFHSSPLLAVKRLQKAIGLTGAAVDGKLGPKTLQAVLRSDPRILSRSMLLARVGALTKQIREDLAEQWGTTQKPGDLQLDNLGGWWNRLVKLALEVGP